MKKLTFRIVILVLIIAGIFGYNRFMHGNLKIDRELVNDENLNLLADNWKKLNVHEAQHTDVDGTDWLYLLDKSSRENVYAQVWVNMGDPSIPSPVVVEDLATYNRYNLKDVLDDYAEDREISCFGKSFNQIFVSNSRLAILFWEYEAEATADNFEVWFRELLQTAQS